MLVSIASAVLQHHSMKFLRIVCWLFCSITTVGDSMSKQFSDKKGDKMLVLAATVVGLYVDVPVGIVRQDLALAMLSVSDTAAITISLERLVSLAQSVSC